MQNLIIQIMNQYGYIGIALLIAVENIFPPIPSEVILTFGGFMTTYSSMNAIIVVVAATVGSVVGALVLYGIGRFFSAERIEKWLDGKIGKILRLKKSDVEKAKGWFEKRGKYTVFFCRFIPIIRSLISIPAGMTSMKIVPFIVLTTGGSLIWNVVLVYLGVFTGKSWTKVVDVINQYANIIMILLIGIFLIGGFLFYHSRKAKKA